MFVSNILLFDARITYERNKHMKDIRIAQGSGPSMHRQKRKPGERTHWIDRRTLRPKLEWASREQPTRKPPTMPVITTRDATDADISLPNDPVAQTAAETYISAWLGWQMKQKAKAQAQAAPMQAVEIPIEDEDISIRDVPADVLDGIATELRRIAGLSGDGPRFSTYQA
ncbi:hypothetical protein [Methylorubrum thiocyanatum]|uniref:hypothetical protein n=1 Tax=Methylorubrum thiocyanatum TaxID=47958 RepID=UPI00364E3FFB